jgi:hypothetical protein
LDTGSTAAGAWRYNAGRWLVRGRGFFVTLMVGVLVLGVAGPAGAKRAPQLKVKLIEFKIRTGRDFVAKGTTTFVVRNGGSEKHEMVVARADDASALPTKPDGSVDEKAIPKKDRLGEIPEFKAGATKTKSFKLTPGTYVLFCNIVEDESGGEVVSHFKEGMHTTIEAS